MLKQRLSLILTRIYETFFTFISSAGAWAGLVIFFLGLGLGLAEP